jgi:hypothetical protein
MNKYLTAFCVVVSMVCEAQIDKEKLALEVSKAEEANTEKLKAYIWKRKSDVSIDGQQKLTTVTEFSFDAAGKLQAKIIDAQGPGNKKPGRAAEEKMQYAGKALELTMAYAYMTKGQMLDFFTKAIVFDKDGLIQATGTDIFVKGDRLTVLVDPATKLFTYKKLSSMLGPKDPMDAELKYEKFTSGINHGTTSVLNLPAKKIRIDAVNEDYSQRVK